MRSAPNLARICSASTNRVWGRFAGFLKPGDIRRMARLCGLSPEEAVSALKNEAFNAAWQREVKENEAFLNAHGLWGVPCLRYGELLVWGQDRLWRIEQEVLRDCQ